jgi:citrate lyase beta subunit
MKPDQIRSLLFVPASAPDRIGKALSSGADVVCLDLEDAVGLKEKSKARETMLAVLRDSNRRDQLCVRMNALCSAEGLEDAAALVREKALPGYIMLPKAEWARDMELLAQAFKPRSAPRFIALLETPLGIEASFAIAGTAAVSMLLFGSFDYVAQTGCRQDWANLLPTRARVVAAAASAGKVALDSPFASLNDLAGAADEARLAGSLGFSGKAAIHPKFLSEIHEAFTPTVAELETARAVIAAYLSSEGAVNRLGETLVEAPVVRRMQRLIERAENSANHRS